MLRLCNLSAGYGKKPVIHDVSIEVPAGTITCIVGPNGAGKSTLLKAICGLAKINSGKMEVAGKPYYPVRPSVAFAQGIVLLPQGRRVFPGLTVKENVLAGAFQLDRKNRTRRLEHVLERFSGLFSLLNRQAGLLSGGQQQQVSIARALMTEPSLLLLDEPSLGLDGSNLNDVYAILQSIQHEDGVTMLVVEHRVRKAVELSDCVVGMKLGALQFTSNSKEIDLAGQQLAELYT